MDGAVVVALFRHGITEENKKRAFLGWTDAPLSKEAVLELEKRKFAQFPYQWLVTSDLKRCIQTADLLFPRQKSEKMHEFRELHFGMWEGKVHTELEGDPDYERWLNHWLDTEIPGGESAKLFHARVQSGWEKMSRVMVRQDITSAALVAHGGVMRYLLSRYGDVERDFWDWNIPHGSGFELIWTDLAAFRRGERCTLLQEVPLTENLHG